MKKLTPLKSIRKKCIDCSGGSYQEVRFCQIEECPLYTYRHGKRPTTKSVIIKENIRPN